MDSSTWVSTNSMQQFSEENVWLLFYLLTETHYYYYYVTYVFIYIRLCKGVLELLWEDISNSVFPVTEACKMRKNILLHKLKHGLNDSTITSVKDLNQLRSKSNILNREISSLEEEYEKQDCQQNRRHWFETYAHGCVSGTSRYGRRILIINLILCFQATIK